MAIITVEVEDVLAEVLAGLEGMIIDKVALADLVSCDLRRVWDQLGRIVEEEAALDLKPEDLRLIADRLQRLARLVEGH
jgi:hypothetical protein